MSEKVVGPAVAAAGAALVAAGPVGWGILAAGAIGVGLVAFIAGEAEGQDDRAQKQAMIERLEARIRSVEGELADTKRLTKQVVEKLVRERTELRAQLDQLKAA
jgi:hypothetical protein